MPEATSLFAVRTSIEHVEESAELAPKFDADGLITCVTTQADTGELLMVGYMNAQALERTISHDLQQEIDYLLGFDRASTALNSLLDWPAHSMELFIRVVRDNDGTLSANKRKSHFSWMQDDEVALAENAVQAAFSDETKSRSSRI